VIGEPAGESFEESVQRARGTPSDYDSSGYFEAGGHHLLDPESAFHRYRVANVLALCGPVEGSAAVDLGCGWGTITFALARGGARVVGVDFSSESIRLCEERARTEPHPGLTFLQADAGSTGLGGGEWDLVVAADLVEHLDPATTLRVYREALRLLKPGGRLVVWAPNPGHILEFLRRRGILKADPTHIDYKTLPRVVAELERTGFRICTAVHVESHLLILSTLERLTQRFVPCLRRRVAVVAERPD